jgi:hypothetical protein
MKGDNKVMTTHTPGPWKVTQIGKKLYVEHDVENHTDVICDLLADDDTFLSAQEKQCIPYDAALIAAAPALLEALKVVSDYYSDELVKPAWFPHVEQAIAQAEGGKP